MLLSEMVESIYEIIDFNPELERFRTTVINRINSRYQQINNKAPWLFLHKKKNFALKAEVVGALTETITIAVTNRRLVTGVNTTFTSAMEGQTLVLDDDTEYTIGRYVSPTVIYLTKPATAVAAITDWQIQFRRYPLPADCAEALGWTSRNDKLGRLTFVDARTEEDGPLLRTTRGTSFVVIEDEHLTDLETRTAPSGVARSGGALAASTEYDYCWCHRYEGRLSQPSTTKRVTTTAVNMEVRIANLPDMRWSEGAYTNLETGREKVIFRRDVTNDGPWLRIAKVDAAASFFDDAVVLPAAAWGWDDPILKLRWSDSPVQFVRMWYEATKDREISLRYKVKHPNLAGAGSSPLWPEQFHQGLVYRVLADLYRTNGDITMAKTYMTDAEDITRGMNKYLTREDRFLVKSAWDLGQSGRKNRNYGVPSKIS